jgi:hypothetical protein
MIQGSISMSSYTVSARAKQFTNLPIMEFLGRYYSHLKLSQIESVFGFVERSALYGGRPFIEPELMDQDIADLFTNKIGIRLPLSNHKASRDEYEESRPFLDKYHRDGNSVIITNDDLAGWIRQDFPRFHIEASVIKNIDNQRKLRKALKIYDTVVLPAKCNNDVEFLQSIVDKDRIRIFLNAGCAYNCSSKICYPSVSEMNKYQGASYRCSQQLIPRDVQMREFDEHWFVSIGFTRFKLLRSGGITAF